MPLIPTLKSLFAGSGAGLIDSAKGLISQFKLSPEQEKQFAVDLEKEVNRHMETLEGNLIKQQEIENADRDSARTMNSHVQESDKSSWMAKNIAYILDVLVGLVWASLTLYIAAISARLIETKADFTGILSLYSTVVAVFMISLNFHRGTSRGSEKKQELIDRMRK